MQSTQNKCIRFCLALSYSRNTNKTCGSEDIFEKNELRSKKRLFHFWDYLFGQN